MGSKEEEKRRAQGYHPPYGGMPHSLRNTSLPDIQPEVQSPPCSLQYSCNHSNNATVIEVWSSVSRISST
ncbi:hypothetical protein TNCV_117611 [Trichonephila clavipes]|nr:hypothetical protein TNCV_117611 [Trichonephila clavipes]